MFPLVKKNCGIEYHNLHSFADIYIYGKTRLDGYLTKKLGILVLLYVHIGDYSTKFEVVY